MRVPSLFTLIFFINQLSEKVSTGEKTVRYNYLWYGTVPYRYRYCSDSRKCFTGIDGRLIKKVAVFSLFFKLRSVLFCLLPHPSRNSTNSERM
jgi:hypothetical protein